MPTERNAQPEVDPYMDDPPVIAGPLPDKVEESPDEELADELKDVDGR